MKSSSFYYKGHTKMSKKYSDIRERLQIVVDKKTTNEMAHLTHYCSKWSLDSLNYWSGESFANDRQ